MPPEADGEQEDGNHHFLWLLQCVGDNMLLLRQQLTPTSPTWSLRGDSRVRSVCVLSCSSHVQLFVTPWTVACQAPLSMGFSRQEYWSGLPCPPPGDLPDPGTEPVSLMSPALVGGFFTTSTTWEVGHTDPKEHRTWVEMPLRNSNLLADGPQEWDGVSSEANHVNSLHPCGVVLAFRAMTSQTTGCLGL